MWRVAVEPPEVTTGTEVWLTGMVVVVVPPFEVKTWLTVGLLAIEMETVLPLLSTTEVEVAGVDGADGE
jgi:hypothetical protein